MPKWFDMDLLVTCGQMKWITFLSRDENGQSRDRYGNENQHIDKARASL